jgi:tRNA pseudouridine38-40 synthase
VPTYRLDIGYDGSGFHGYARNPGVRTVQGDLEAALAQILGIEVKTAVAGRTDAGVHARGQVVSFDADPGLDVDRIVRSLRSMLGREVAVHSLVEAEAGFHARRSAQSRVYRYLIDDSPVPDPFTRNVVWHVAELLDLDAMNRAAAAFVGTHDFASFCRAQIGRSTLRTVFRAEWTRQQSLVVYEVHAKAFCHQMVRSMVAVCVEVGRDRFDAEAVPGVLVALDRNAAPRGTAPPHGLVLDRVVY